MHISTLQYPSQTPAILAHLKEKTNSSNAYSSRHKHLIMPELVRTIKALEFMKVGT
jgi:hypothetical protein